MHKQVIMAVKGTCQDLLSGQKVYLIERKSIASERSIEGEYLSASRYLLNSEKTVSNGTIISSVKSEDRFQCLIILGFTVSCFCPDNADGNTSSSNIASFSRISANIENIMNSGGVVSINSRGTACCSPAVIKWHNLHINLHYR